MSTPQNSEWEIEILQHPHPLFEVIEGEIEEWEKK